MLNDCIHCDKQYILALEHTDLKGRWPTLAPNEPKGDLTRYQDVTGMLTVSSPELLDVSSEGSEDTAAEKHHHPKKPELLMEVGKQWETKIQEALELLCSSLETITREKADVFLRSACTIAKNREQELDQERSKLDEKVEDTEKREEEADLKKRQLMRRENDLKADEEALAQDREMLEVSSNYK